MLYPTVLAPYMHGNIEEFVVETWGGVARRLFALHCSRMNPHDFDDANGLDYDFEKFAEIFGSSGRRGLPLMTRYTILGYETSEQPENPVPGNWIGGTDWHTMAVAGSEAEWSLQCQQGAGCAMCCLRYTYDGYSIGYWFYLEA